MTTRLAAWIVGALAVTLVLSMIAPGAFIVLAVPVAVVGSVLIRRRPAGHEDRDVAERLVAGVATLTGEGTSSDGEQVDWGAALRAELATITVPRERRRFALGAAVALLGKPHTRSSFVVAAGVAVAFGAGLLGVSRAGLGDDGLGSVTMLLPPVLLFAIASWCARSRRSLRFGLDTGILAALTTLVAVAVVYGVEAAHWYHLAPDVSVLDGDHVDLDSTRAAVLDAANPVILLVHLVFWSPWPLLGARAGARAPRTATG
jgi:O-antigen/teichoic acid export membrane protein